ncbi:InlB B-repeat-containing protein, partial [Olsenella sp. KH1P3]
VGVYYQSNRSAGFIKTDPGVEPDSTTTAPAIPSGFSGDWRYVLGASQTDTVGVVYDSDTKPLAGTLSLAPGATASIMDLLGTKNSHTHKDWTFIIMNATNSATADLTVTFHANGGSGTMAAQTVPYNTAAALNSNAFTNPGYAFTGWSTTAGGSVAYGNGATVTLTSNLDLYAVWTARNDYKVTYDAGSGGTFGGSNTSDLNGLSFTSVVPATAPAGAPTRSGFNFTGYNTKADGTGLAISGSQTYDQLVAANGAADADSVTVYAQWSAKASYTISYNTSGADSGANPASTTVVDGSNVTLDAGTGFARTGYDFGGWSDGSTTYSGGASFGPVTSNVQFIAVWNGKAATIVFNKVASDATGTMGNLTGYKTGETVPALTANAFSRNGYNFAGWTTASNGTGTVIPDGASFVVPATSDGVVNLYAKWTARNDYMVYFDKNGGSGDSSKSGLSWGSTAFTPGAANNTANSNPTRGNYSFQSWNTSKDGSGMTVNASTVYSAIDSFFNNDSSHTGYVTVYAIWQENMVTINYAAGSAVTGLEVKVNGASGTSKSESVGSVSGKHTDDTSIYGAEVVIPTGYVFDKWTTDGAGMNAVSNSFVNGTSHKITPLPNAGVYDAATYYLWVTPRSDLTYTIEFYLENSGSTDSTIASNYSKDTARTVTVNNATMGDVVTPTNANGNNYTITVIPGYSYVAPSVLGDASITVNATGPNVLKLYFKFNSLNIVYNWTGNVPGTITFPTSPVTAHAGDTVTTPDPGTYYGYKFNGWTATYNDGSVRTLTLTGSDIKNKTFTMPGYDVRLIGDWSYDTFDVTYDTTDAAKGTIKDNGTDTSNATITKTGIAYNSTPTDVVTVAEKDTANWYFIGWTCDMDTDGDGVYDVTGVATANPMSVTILGKTLFTAQWGTTMTIAYDPGVGGDWSLSDASTTGLTLSDPIPAFPTSLLDGGFPKARPGYEFVGWKWTEGGASYADYAGETGTTQKTRPVSPDPVSALGGSTTFVAQWKLIRFTLTYVHTQEDGTDFSPAATWGAGVPDPNESHAAGESFTLKSSGITRDGYTLRGWKFAGDPTVYNAGSNINMPAAASVLYPVWDEAYVTINYAASPTAGGTVTVSTESVKSASGTHNDGTGISGSQAIPSTGYTLVGWKVGSASGASVPAAWVATDGTLTPQVGSSGIYDAETYYAVFEPIQYTVTYTSDANGSITGITTENVAYGSNPAGTSASGNPGYVLDGWEYNYKDATGNTLTGTSYNVAFPTTITIYDNATFKAIYKAASGYTVLYDELGGSAVSDRTGLTYDAANILPTGVSTKAGYTLAGWYWTSDFTSGTDVTSTMKFNEVYERPNVSTKTANSLTLYAKWVEKTGYTVRYNTEGGVSPTGNANAFDDKNPVTWTQTGLLPSENPVKDGYTFDGWYKSETDFSAPNKVSSGDAYSSLAASDSVMTVTLYAHYIENTYVVKYDTDGGNPIADKTGVKWGDTNLTVTPTKTGYTFVKWVYYGPDHVTLTSNEATSATPFSTIAGNDSSVSYATIKAIWAQDGKYNVQYFIVSADGTVTSMHHQSTPVSAAAGTVVDATNATPNPENIDYRTESIPGYHFDASDTNNVLSVTIVSGSTVPLKLYFRENTFYSVGYDLNGGTAGSGGNYSDKTGVAWTQKGLIPSVDPVRNGYTFGGWEYTPDGGATATAIYGTNDPSYGQIAGDPAASSTAKRILKAIWNVASVTINYIADPFGYGSVYATTETVNALTGLHSDGSTITGSTPTANSGYKFIGWVYNDDSGEHAVNAAWVDASNKLTPQAESGAWVARTYIAKFADLSATTYTVEHYKQALDGSYGTTPDDVDTISATEGTAISSIIPKSYTGFTYNPSVTGTVYTGVVGVDSGGNPTLVLKAFYTRNAHKVTYQYNNSVSGAPALPSPAVINGVLYGDTFTVSDPAPTLSHYTFNGWNVTDASGSTITVAADHTFAMPDSDVTISGNWVKESYVVNFISGDTSKGLVTGTGTTQNVDYNGNPSMANVSATPSTGYYLVGWDYDMDTDGDGVIDANGSTKRPQDIAILGNTTFTAIWAHSFTVSYLPGSVGTFTAHVAGRTEFANLAFNAVWPGYNGEVDSLTSDPAGQTGYVFLGWMWEDGSGNKHYTYNDSANGITQETLPTAVDTNYTLTAMWEGKPYDLTFMHVGTDGNEFSPVAVWGSGVTVTSGNVIENHKAGTTVTLLGTGAITRAGYTLKGWTTDGSDFWPESDTGFVMPAANTKLYPVWDYAGLVINYVANPSSYGGVSRTSDSLSTESAAPAGSTATANTGYKFDHWEDASGNTITDPAWISGANGETLTPQKNGSGFYDAVTYTAVFVADANTNYTVEYWLADDATNSTFSHNTTYKADEILTGTTGTTVNAPSPAPSITGFTFDSPNAGNVLSTTILADGSAVLRLFYTRNIFTLTYAFAADVPSGATSVLPATTTVAYGIVQTVPTGFENSYPGYTFVGWTTSDGTTPTTVAADGTFSMPAMNLTVTGTWAVKDGFEVVYEENNDDDAAGIDVIDLTNVKWHDSGFTNTTRADSTSGNPTRAGYNFGGWFLDNGVWAQPVTPGSTYGALAGSDTVTKVTLYAKWDEAGDYAIEYYDDPATLNKIASDRTGVAWSTTGLGTSIFSAPASRTGYKVDGWAYQKADGTMIAITPATVYSTAYTDGQGAAKILKLYANWVGITYTIKFDANDATYPTADPATGSMTDQSVTYGAAGDSLTPNAYSREGYNFIAWNVIPSGLGTAYADMQAINPDFTSTDGDVITLYAIWGAKSQDSSGTPYSVIYDEDGGNAVVDLPESSTVPVVKWDTANLDTVYDAAYKNPTTPRKAGFNFIGWFTDNVTWSHQVTAGETYGQLVKLLGGNDETNTLTLYAKWDEIGGFQVIYEENNDDDPTGVDVDDLPNSVV